jgi:hypothetical protein
MVTTRQPDRSRITVEAAASGELRLRCEQMLVVRTNRGTWSIEFQASVDGVRRGLQVPIGRHKALNRLAIEITGGDVIPVAKARRDQLIG